MKFSKRIWKLYEFSIVTRSYSLPSNYNFEIPKTIWKIRATKSKYVALQFPEGLLIYSCIISDILEKHTECEIIIMGDVTYGACCIDDFTAKELGCNLLVHYGHSCLIPIQDTTGVHVLYVFVTIDLNITHIIDVIKNNFDTNERLAFVSTIQFVQSLQSLKCELECVGYKIIVPQCRPLSPGEILGCTSPKLPQDVTRLIFVGDGRFHLESIMIQNPSVSAYQYDPYSRRLSKEKYDYNLMVAQRKEAIEKAKCAKVFGLIQGCLGRQGNVRIVEDLECKLKAANKLVYRILLSEITDEKLTHFDDIECFVQVACPRLSIDWGSTFTKPLLNPYELAIALQYLPASEISSYSMDYYADDSSGPWTNNHTSHRAAIRSKQRRPVKILSE